MSRDEIDTDAKRWTVPAKRMKKGLPHLVPLVPRIAALLEDLPRHAGGDFLFSATGGAKPIAAFSKMKAKLDDAMKVELAKEGKPFEPWTIHDIRRTVRTGLSRLKVDLEIRERILAHIPAKLVRTYDKHDFEDEKRAALEAWYAELKRIAEPRPALRIVA